MILGYISVLLVSILAMQVGMYGCMDVWMDGGLCSVEEVGSEK
jgi:hypothetical protein